MAGGTEDYDFIFKVVLIGDTRSGKSQLLTRFARDEYTEDSKSTIGVEFCTKILPHKNDKKIKLQLWDTDGRLNNQQITQAYYRGSLAVVITVDLAAVNPLKNLQKYIDEIDAYASSKPLIYVVATKWDLPTAKTKIEQLKKALGTKHQLHITSAKKGDNVNELFNTLAADCYDALQKNDSQNEKPLIKDHVEPNKFAQMAQRMAEKEEKISRKVLDDTLEQLDQELNKKAIYILGHSAYENEWRYFMTTAKGVVSAIQNTANLSADEITTLTKVVQETRIIAIQDDKSDERLADYAALIQHVRGQGSWGKFIAGAMVFFLGATLTALFVTAAVASFGAIPALTTALIVGTTALAQGLSITIATLALGTTIGGVILMAKGCRKEGIALATSQFFSQAEKLVKENPDVNIETSTKSYQ